jgi:hypothetical protein
MAVAVSLRVVLLLTLVLVGVVPQVALWITDISFLDDVTRQIALQQASAESAKPGAAGSRSPTRGVRAVCQRLLAGHRLPPEVSTHERMLAAVTFANQTLLSLYGQEQQSALQIVALVVWSARRAAN